MTDIEDIKKAFLDELGSVKASSELQQLKVKYLGKKGILTAKLKLLSTVPLEERPAYGKLINELKTFIEGEIDSKEAQVKHLERTGRIAAEAIDITLPGDYIKPGRMHPISTILKEIIDIFADR